MDVCKDVGLRLYKPIRNIPLAKHDTIFPNCLQWFYLVVAQADLR